MRRLAVYAGSFYPKDEKECLEMFHSFEEKAQHEAEVYEGDSCIGIAPHAGWVYSGYIAYLVFRSLKRSNITPKTFIIFGAIHVPGVSQTSIWPRGKWETVLGDIDIDEDLQKKIVAHCHVKEDSKAHLHEHSIEVLLPFLKYFFPSAKIVPLMVTVDQNARCLGEQIGELINNDVFAICSTDLTHYGSRFCYTPKGLGEQALKWVKNENDKRIIDLMLKLEDNKIIEEVYKNRNACGGGAIAATLAFAKAKQRNVGKLLNYATSYDIHPQDKIDNFVGYSGILI